MHADQPSIQANAGKGTTLAAFISVTTLFFAWGFITSLIDPLVAAVKGIFSLSDVEAQLSASAFFIAYGLISMPAALLVSRLRAAPSILVALGMMIAGCAIMLLAANVEAYGLVLAGLFVLASGITTLQVAANPLAAALGPPESSHFRLTLSQTFNSLGTFIGPYIGAVLFLRGLNVGEGEVVSEAVRQNTLLGIDRAYFWLGGLIALLLVFFFFARKTVDAAAPAPSRIPSLGALIKDAFSSRWALLGAMAIFLYVGAEVSIGTMMTLFLNSDGIWGTHDAPRAVGWLANFMQLDDVPGVSLEEAAKAVSLYWGGAMIGRFVGTALLARFKAPLLLALFTAIATMMCLFVAAVGGAPAGFVALMIGLFNSIMFPVIFTITLERSTASPEATSGLLCTAIIGGAILPIIVGLISERVGYAAAFSAPMVCYSILCWFALAAGRAKAVRSAEELGSSSPH
jgi:FHS family L-fucose permease-like MFS transporter